MYVTKIQLFPNIVNFDNRSTTIVDAFSLVFFIEKQIHLQPYNTIPYLVLFHVTHNTSSPNIYSFLFQLLEYSHLILVNILHILCFRDRFTLLLKYNSFLIV